jgi:hypothetical protein
MKTMKITRLALIATATVGATIALPSTAHADQPPPCSSGQVAVSASWAPPGLTHRAVLLTFTLTPGAAPCTLTGYPGVDSGAGGPLIHAQRTLSGYLGGLPADVPPTVTVSESQQAQAVVEGMAVDANGNQCPTYTDLRVTAPDTTDTVTVPATIDTCQLQVHPIGSVV